MTGNLATVILEHINALPWTKLKREHDHWRGNSPLRPDANSSSFCLWTDGNWRGYCDHVSDAKGSLWQLGEQLGLDMTTYASQRDEYANVDLDAIPETKPAKPPRRSFASLAEYAEYQGLPIEVFTAAGCREEVVDGRLCIVFPASDGIDRLRNLTSEDKKWYPRPGSHGVKPVLYGFNRALQLLANNEGNKTLILCNGQPSVIVAQYYGLPAFAVTEGENKNIPDNLLAIIKAELAKGIKLIIAKDNDSGGQTGTQKTYTQLQEYNPALVDWSREKAGYDLANHCQRYTTQSWPELLRLTGQPAVTMAVGDMMATQLADTVGKLTQAVRTQQIANLDDTLIKIRQIVDTLQDVATTDGLHIPDASAEIENWVDIVRARMNSEPMITGLHSGLTLVDTAINGFNRGLVHTFLGETGSGKSQLMAMLAYSFLGQGTSGLVVSCETTIEQFMMRLAAVRCGVPFGEIRRGSRKSINASQQIAYRKFTSEERTQILSACHMMEGFRQQRKLLFPTANKVTTAARLWRLAQQASQQGATWMIVDSLNNIALPGHSEYEAVSQAAIMCETIATQLNIIVVATAQGGRNIKERSKKQLGIHDARGSGVVEEKAAVLFSIYNHALLLERGEVTERDDKSFPPGTVRLYPLKSRETGVTGGHITVRYWGGVGFKDFSS